MNLDWIKDECCADVIDKYTESHLWLISKGYVRNVFGDYEDYNNLDRSGAYINPYTGEIEMDM